MIFRQIRPEPPLDRFIANFWYWKGDPLPHSKELIMASPTMGLLVNLHEDALRHYDGDTFDVEHRSRGIALSGANTQNFAIDAVQPEIMGAQFHAGGAFPFFAPSARLFCNRHVALEDVWGAAATSLHHQLVEAPTIAAKFDTLRAALLARMPREPAHHPAVELALARFGREGALRVRDTRASDVRAEETRVGDVRVGDVRVGDVAAESGLCRRRFIDLFAEEVGFTPKLYLRLLRFGAVLQDVFGASSVDWSEIAYRHGYADQSHFNREFREFSGLTPSQYLARPGQGAQHAELIETS